MTTPGRTLSPDHPARVLYRHACARADRAHARMVEYQEAVADHHGMTVDEAVTWIFCRYDYLRLQGDRYHLLHTPKTDEEAALARRPMDADPERERIILELFAKFSCTLRDANALERHLLAEVEELAAAEDQAQAAAVHVAALEAVEEIELAVRTDETPPPKRAHRSPMSTNAPSTAPPRGRRCRIRPAAFLGLVAPPG